VPFVSQLTQNWLPSGSAMTVQTELGPLCSATRVAPSMVSRATASMQTGAHRQLLGVRTTTLDLPPTSRDHSPGREVSSLSSLPRL